MSARSLIEVEGLSKTFYIPSVRRDTVREHVFGLLEPRRFEPLRVLDQVSFDLRPGETLVDDQHPPQVSRTLARHPPPLALVHIRTAGSASDITIPLGASVRKAALASPPMPCMTPRTMESPSPVPGVRLAAAPR